MKMVVILLAVVGLILQGVFITVEDKKKYVAAALLKGLAALMFVTIGILGYMNGGKSIFALNIVLGLIFGMLGDVTLNFRYIFKKHGQKFFIAGTIVFFIGHIFYLCSLIPQSCYLLICMIVGLLCTLIFAFIIFRVVNVKTLLKFLGQFYVFAIFTMNILAFQIAAVSTTIHNVMFAVGGLLFATSDIILIFNTFGKKHNPKVRVFYLYVYFLGQTLIASSLFYLN